MKLTKFSFLVAGLVACSASAQEKSPSPAAPAPAPTASMTAEPAAPVAKPTEPLDKQKLGTALGLYFGRSATNQMIGSGINLPSDLDEDALFAAFHSVFASAPPVMEEQEMTNILNQLTKYRREQAALETKKMIDAGPETKAKGIKFLEDNAKLPDVKVLTNGLQYKVIKEGEGESPTATDIVHGSLRITTIDGVEVGRTDHTEISLSRGLPAGVVQAFTMMKAGSKWTVYAPYDLAYKDQPWGGTAMRPPKIGPFSAMIFELEVESFRHMPAPATPPASARSLPPGLTAPPAAAGAPASAQISSGEIVRVPSTEEYKRGSNAQVLTKEQIDAYMKAQTQTNQTNK